MRTNASGGTWARRLGWALLAVSLVMSVPYLGARWADEARTYRHVALALDLEEWADLANAHGGDLRGFLAEVRRLGVNLLSLKAPTLGRLELEGLVAIHDPLLAPAAPADLTFDYRPGRLYVRPVSDALFAQLAELLPLRLRPEAVRLAAPYIEIQTDIRTARELRGGLSPADMALAAELGFGLLLRPTNARGADPALQLGLTSAGPGAAAVILPPGTVILHQGVEVLGYPDDLERAAAVINQYGLTLGLLETPVQLGLTEQAGYRDLARLVDYRAVRVHAFSELELKKLVPEDLTDRSMRAVRDRGIAVLYLKAIPPVTEQYAWEPLVSRSLRYYGSLATDLAAQGYEIGPARANGVEDRPLAAVSGLAGAVGGALLLAGALLDQLRVSRRQWAIVMLAPFGLAPLSLLARLAGGSGLAREFAAFVIAVTLPPAAVLLAGEWLAKGAGQRTGGARHSSAGPPSGAGRTAALRGVVALRGVAALAGATLLGIAGGFLVAGTLSGPLYTLEFAYFRGVKIAHLLPAAVAVGLGILAWWRRDEGAPLSWSSLAGRMREFLASPVTWGAAAFAGVAGIGLLMILGRSGHTAGFQVSRLEVALRDLFDVRLYARPRFKEILLGHPALIYLAVAGLAGLSRGRWGWVYALGLGAASIGQISVVNSFSHIRTPLVVSLVRSINGFWVGVLLAAVVATAAWTAWRLFKWVARDD